MYHIYAVLVENRDKVRARLNEAGIASGIHYPLLLHLQPCLSELDQRRGDFPVAERVADQELSLPMFPELTAEQVAAVCDALNR